MPAARPRASFEPIPPDFDVHTFVETANNFQYVDRISYEMIANNGIEQFEKLVLLHVIIGGKPLVIDGFEEVLDPWTFTPSWLRDNHGEKVENARNLTSQENIPLTIKHYLKHMGKLTEQFFDDPDRYREKTRQRIYLKDIDCPPVWQDKLKEHIPAGLFYLNDSTGEYGGPGSTYEAGMRKGRGIARSGDLMSSLPPEMRAENLMCYVGHEGTYTPSHREMCASLGQNIMVNASGTISEDGKPERPGSSIWFMTETKDRRVVSEYWLSVLGHDIEVENHFAQLIAWKKAPFKTYVVEQRAGDFILIPPLAPHQVWNRGTRTMKIAWNRTTVETLEMAISEALPNSRVVCRDEQYKNKSIIYYTLVKYCNLIRSARSQIELGGEQAEAIQRSVKVRQVQRDFKRLFDLYKQILLSEMFAPDSREHPEFVAYDSNVTCAYCRCNIFNRFLTCKSCAYMFNKEIEEPYDICMDCYCMGRSCACQSSYQWVEQWKWKDLLHKYEEWRAQIIDIDGHMTEKTPLPLQEERRYQGKKPLAQVCQEQLKVRPFFDVNNPKPTEESHDDEEIIVNDDGMVKRTVKKRSKAWLNQNKSCHFCLHRHPKWKMAFCSKCDLSYCYGTLFRAHDMMPLQVMEDFNWKCPHCRRVCNTGACRRDPRQHPYEPKGTLLGHDTKKVADVRSVECLVDFSVSNLNWLREDEMNGPNNGRLQRRRDEAERAKLDDPSMDDRFRDENHHLYRNGIEYSPVEDERFHGNHDTSYMGSDAFGEPSLAVHGNHIGGDEFSSYYHNPDIGGEIPRLGQKRGRDGGDEEGFWRTGRVKKPKKNKRNKDETAPFPPKNVSGKQYQKEVERKLLEEAKKEGRYILVAARMKGKSRIIKLSLRSALLAQFRGAAPAPHSQEHRPVEDEPIYDPHGSAILESDLVPATNDTSKTGPKPKPHASFRFRVEQDDSYGSRKRNDILPRPGQPKRKTRYEELTLDSDEEGAEDEMVEYNTTERSGLPRGRASNWLARKNEGEEDLPTELPANFRDGDVNPEKRARERKRKETMPAKPLAQIHPPGHRSRESAGNVSDHDGVHEEDDTTNTALQLAQSAAAALEASRQVEAETEKIRVAAAEKEATENLRAKMALAAELSDGASGDNNNFDVVETFAEDHETLLNKRQDPPKASPVVRSGPPQSENSIFARPGMSGKKIKIVSSKKNGVTPSGSKTPATTTVTASASAFTAVNNAGPARRIQARNIDLSSSDSEDEIPAKAPAKALGGCPSMVPTRGGTIKRGRGRPRKSVKGA